MELSPELIELLSQWPIPVVVFGLTYPILRWGIKPIFELWIKKRKQDNDIRANQIEAGERHLSVLGDIMDRQKEFFDEKVKDLEAQMEDLSKVIEEKDRIIKQQLRVIEEKEKTIKRQHEIIEELKRATEKESK